MDNRLDTNIFILSIYDQNYLSAFKKFVKDERGPLPLCLHKEITKKITDLITLMGKINSDLNNDIELTNIPEIKDLEINYSNIFNTLKHRTKKFNDKKALSLLLNEFQDKLEDVDSWLDSISHYPEDRLVEKNILKKYKIQLTKLKRVRGLHREDLEILCIANHQKRNTSDKVNFVTRDGELSHNKNIIEEELQCIKVIKVLDYLKLA